MSMMVMPSHALTFRCMDSHVEDMVEASAKQKLKKDKAHGSFGQRFQIWL